MRYSQGQVGRVLVVRFEDGDRLPQAIEALCEKEKVARGMCILVGGIGGGKIVVGPEDGSAMPPVPMFLPLDGVHEIAGAGVIVTGPNGKPSLHMHAALGRGDQTRAGCIRPGIDVWKVVEAVILEIVENTARRQKDNATGFELLEP